MIEIEPWKVLLVISTENGAIGGITWGRLFSSKQQPAAECPPANSVGGVKIGLRMSREEAQVGKNYIRRFT